MCFRTHFTFCIPLKNIHAAKNTLILSKIAHMSFMSIIGITAAILTTAAYVPQAYKTIKTRSTKDLSVGTFSMLFFGTVLWFIYGWHLSNTPIILANLITAILAGVILVLKWTAKD